MKKRLREYIRKQINFLFEVDAASAAASAAQGTSMGMSSDAMADTIANYDELKANQENLILAMQEKLKKEKERQKINLDKIKKLNNTFSQVQDSELALIPGGKSEDNKVKKMKQTSYLKDKKDLEAKSLFKEMGEYLKIGKRNHIAYLSSDHLDVYVATSMRLEHEYIFVNRFVSNVFSKEILAKLKIRWFDPTQAYCDDRIDKGLSEALMLKRAKCTLYLVQESDTFGKDSELASTLAQGKPVVAYVPNGNRKYVDDLLSNLCKLNPDKAPIDIILEQLEVFKPSLACH